MDENGAYTYTTDGNTDITIVITFAEKQLEQLVMEDTTLYNTTWSSSDTDKKIVIGADGKVTYGGEPLMCVDDSDQSYCITVRIDGQNWLLYTNQANKNTLELMSTVMIGDVSPDYTFTKDGGSTAPTTYTVTVQYDDDYVKTMGTATVDKTTCNDGDTVTLTVNAAAGYTVQVTANSETLTVGPDGKYTFEVHSDTTIVVTFTSTAA